MKTEKSNPLDHVANFSPLIRTGSLVIDEIFPFVGVVASVTVVADK
jgi:hypothetical protein